MAIQRHRRPLIEPLESRLLFSATGDIAVIDDGNSDVAYLLNAAESVDLVAIYGDHLPLTTSHSDWGAEPLQSNEYSEFREVVFIDTNVANFQQLLDDILQHTDSNKVDVITLDPKADGLAQINSALLHYSNLTAIHLITHGQEGTVNLGGTTLAANNIQAYKDEFLIWQNALQDNADILIYGCNVAATEEGVQLVELLANLTKADVAASNDLTGHKDHGGDWELEVRSGDIESSIIVSEAMQEQWVGMLANVDHIFVDVGPYELGVSTFSNIGQSFTYDSAAATYGVNSVSFLMKKDVGAPVQTITVELRTSWNGSVLGSSTISSNLLSSSQLEWKTFSFANVDLNDNQTYVIRISSTDSSGSVKFSYHQANQYINTSAYIQSGTPNASGWDMAFKVSGDNGINSSPTISNPIPNQSTSENSNFNFQFAANTFNDLDGDTLTYTATLSNNNPLPSWLSFNANTRTFSGVPDDADVGTISIKVNASDGRGGIVTDQFDLVISNVNDNPFINIPVPNQNATEDSAFNYTFPANTFGDDDVGASFTYTAELAGGGALPSWLHFDSATRTFSGTPANGDVGTLSIKLTADDGAGGTASDTFDIVIANTNDAPTVANTIPNQTATENALFNYTFPINTFNDIDIGDSLTYSATLVGGGALPGWLSFDALTRTFSGTPSNGDVGTISIRVTADDGDTTVSDVFDLVIQNVGSSNVVYETSGPSTDTQVISSGVPFFQSFYHDSPSATYTIDSIVLQLVKDPSASLQTITVTLLSGTYNGAVVGTATISSAAIGTTLAWKAFDFPNVVLTDNQVYFIKIESSSVDGLVKAAIHNTDVYPNGSYHSSAGTADTTRDVAFQVSSGANIDPVIVNPIPNQNATEDSAFIFQFAANTFNDADVGDVLTYTATMADGSALPSWLSFNAATRTFSGTPTNSDVGTISVKVTADDSNGGTPATDTFDLVVVNTNDAPTVANPIPNQNATEDSVFNFTFAANTFVDQDVGSSLSYSVQLAGGGVLPSWLSFNAATRTFSGTPANSDVGTISIDVIADDGNGGTVTDTFNIVIANTNDAPTVANTIPNQNATEDAAFNFQFAVNTFADPDVGDTLTYSAQLAGGGALPSWLSFNAATRTFSGTPANGDVGSFSVDVIASDGNGGTVTDTFSITVAGTNDAPVNSVPGAQVTNEDVALVFSVGNGNQIQISDIDVGGGNLEVTLSVTNGTLTLAGIAGLSFTTGDGTADSTLVFTGTLANINTALATLTFNPTSNYNGAAVLSLTTSDLGNTGTGGTLTDTDTVNITVNAVNDAPTVANPIPNQNATEDSAFNFQFAANTFADVDVGATLAYSAQLNGGGALPSWLTFNAATHTFSGTPANGDVGTLSIEVTADDGNGGTVTDTFDIVIANTNDAPTVANAIPNQNATQGAAFNFQFAANTFADVDVGDTLTYSVQLNGGGGLPAWLSFNPATRTFSGTPANGDVGTLSIDVTASDGNGGTITDTFNIVIANINDAPIVANAIPNQNATEDSAFNFQFAANTFADVDARATLTYSAQLVGGGSLPSWLTFNTATRTFSGTPANDDVGTISIDVTADDGNGGTVTDTFNIVIANTNDVPTVANAIPNQNATEDAAFNFQFAANTFADVDAGTTLTYSAQLAGGGSLPSWLTFNAATRTFSGTPANGDVGTISIDVTADDGNGGTVTDTFNIVIANTNDAPTVANAIPDRSATENVAFNFQFAANTFADIDVGDSLTYSAQLAGGGSLPAWLSFNAVTRTFSGTPANGDVGTISIDVIADDGNGGAVTDTFDIVVGNSNDAPTVANAIPNQNATEDAVFNFQFAVNTFADVDVGDTLTYSVQLAGGGSLPSWLTFNAATRTFSGTPANGDVGTISIDVIADDGNGGVVTDTFDIVVANTNDAPVIANAIPDRSATENIAFNFQFAANTFADPDVGDSLTYSVQLAGGGSLPSWLSFNAATRTFSGTPANSDVGTISIDVSADDGNGGTVTDTFNIVVGNTNDAPTVANAIPNQSATEDSAFNFQFAANTFADLDVGDTLTYTAQVAGGSPLPSWLTFNSGTRTFGGTPTNGDVGTISIDVIADDGNGGIVTDTFNIVIVNTNDAPTVANAIPDRSATENVAFNFQFAANTFADVDVGDTLSYTAQLAGGGVLPAWLSFDPLTRTFSGTPGSADLGTVSIDVIASDGNGGNVTDTFIITVNDMNDAPTVANPIPDQNATEDSVFNFQFAVNTFDDIDVGTTLTYTAQLAGGGALPSWLSFDPLTRTFSGTPLNANVGTLSIDVIADDGNGGTVTDTFDIVVANTNDAPTVTNPIANQSATENTAFNFQFAVNTFADVDVGDTLTYTVQLAGGGALPAWLTFNATTRTFSGVPAATNIGTLSIDVIASDGNGGTVTDNFDLVINALPENLPPVVQNGVNDQSVAEDSTFSFTIPANAFSDTEGDPLSYSVQLVGGGALPSWLSFDAATRTFSGTPTNDNVGVINLQVSVSDGNGGSASDNFSITVINTNDAPTVNAPAVNPVAQEDSPLTLSFPLTMFNDVDVGDSLSYSAQLANGQPLPAWLKFDAATLTFSGTPENDDVGDIDIQLIASDGQASVSFQFIIHVEPVNDAPVATGPITINNHEDAAGDQLDLFTVFSDEETPANQLKYSVVSNSNPTLVTGATIDAQTGKLIFSYGANQFGSADLIIRAQDADGATVESSVRINIAPVNDVPISTGIDDIRVDAGTAPQEIDLHKIFSDIEDGASLKYSLIANTNPAIATDVQWDQATGKMTIAFASTTGGESFITLRAQDSEGAWIETRFKVTVVASVVQPPVVVPPEPGIPTTPPIVIPPVIPPTNPPVVDIPTVPPTTPGGTGDGGSGGDVVILPPGISIDPSTPTGNDVPSAVVRDPDDDFNLPNDKSSRDYDRIKAALGNDVSLSLLTASPSLVSLITPDAGFSPWDVTDFDNEVRRVREQMDVALEEEQARKAIIAGITFSVTTGILIWSLRASSLLLTLMSMLPLWRGFDPLPILDDMNKRKEKLEQQRKDKQLEDRHVREVGYLFDQTNNKPTSK